MYINKKSTSGRLSLRWPNRVAVRVLILLFGAVGASFGALALDPLDLQADAVAGSVDSGATRSGFVLPSLFAELFIFYIAGLLVLAGLNARKHPNAAAQTEQAKPTAAVVLPIVRRVTNE